MKSLWTPRRFFEFYCPLCRSPKRTALNPNPWTRQNVFRIALLSLVVMLALWNWLGLKGALVFVPFWTAFEVMYRLYVRRDLICSSCGFDPMLYLADVKRARTAVQLFWSEKLTAKEKAAQSQEKPIAEAPATRERVAGGGAEPE